MRCTSADYRDVIFQSYSFVIRDTKVLYILFAFQLVKRVVNSVLFFQINHHVYIYCRFYYHETHFTYI